MPTRVKIDLGQKLPNPHNQSRWHWHPPTLPTLGEVLQHGWNPQNQDYLIALKERIILHFQPLFTHNDGRMLHKVDLISGSTLTKFNVECTKMHSSCNQCNVGVSIHTSSFFNAIRKVLLKSWNPQNQAFLKAFQNVVWISKEQYILIRHWSICLRG